MEKWNRTGGWALKVSRVRKEGHYHFGAKINVIFAIEPGDLQLSHLHSYPPERTGQVDIEAVRTLHLTTCHDLDLPGTTTMEINYEIAGVRLLQELLSPRSLDQLVS